MLNIRFAIDPARIADHWSQKFPSRPLPADILVTTGELRSGTERNWKSLEGKILPHIESVTGLKGEGTIRIFMLPTELDIGHYLDKETVEFGHGDLYPHYTMIGISHEIIHCLTHDFYAELSDDDKWLFHALVYLSADEEIRFLLNGKSDYFSSPVIETYHKRLLSSARLALPYWIEHMKDPQKESLYELFHRIKNADSSA